jgi:hypothetical protein
MKSIWLDIKRKIILIKDKIVQTVRNILHWIYKQYDNFNK